LTDVAEQVRKLLAEVGLTGPSAISVLFISVRQELRAVLSVQMPDVSFLDQVSSENQIRNEAIRQVGELPFIASELHPYQLLQGLLATMQYTLCEELRTLPASEHDTRNIQIVRNLELLQRVNRDLCLTQPVDVREPALV
jgi:hypothetical protein